MSIRWSAASATSGHHLVNTRRISCCCCPWGTGVTFGLGERSNRRPVLSGPTPSGRRRWHCEIFARQGFTQENPRKRTKIHTALFSSFILPIICDNWSFIIFFDLKFNQPNKTKNIKCIIFSKSIIDYLLFCNYLTLPCIDFCNSGVSSNILRRNCDI